MADDGQDTPDAVVTIVECIRSGWIRHAFAGAIAAGSTIGDVLRQAGLPVEPAPDVGIHGERRSLTDQVAQGDRIEIYRSLEIEPMEARRLRAAVRKRR